MTRRPMAQRPSSDCICRILVLNAGLLAPLPQRAQAWDLYGEIAQGWTHYQAEDLNAFMRLLQAKIDRGESGGRIAGRFDGQFQNSGAIGLRTGRWRLGLESAFWRERFRQKDVPVVLGSTNQIPSSCAALKRQSAAGDSLPSGCVSAEESFLFLPVYLHAAWRALEWERLEIWAGYAVGVMAGKSRVAIETDFYREDLRDDAVTFSLDPGLQPIQKVFAEITWFPCMWMSVSGRGGVRLARLGELRVADFRGQSLVYDAVFNQPEQGDGLYFQSYPGLDGTEELVIASPRDGGGGGNLRPVVSDFTGWFSALSISLYWKDL